ncbi:MAG: HAD family hydrolase [Dehalococcoidia bacterium]
MTKVVLFDLGDTLFRLLPMADVTDDFAGVMAEEGVEDAATEALRVLETFRERLMAGYGRGDLVEPAIAEVVMPFIGNDARARRLAEALDALLGEADIGRWEQAAERDRVFESIRSRGLRVGFVSNTLTAPELMRRRLAEFRLLEHAEAAVFSVEHGIRKPNPEIYRAALRLMRANPEDTVFVGDRVREDVRGPQSVGMRGVLTHEFRQEEVGDSEPLAVVSHLTEILDLL